MASSPAFTLIEVLIALAILALLAYTVASSLSTALRARSSADLTARGVRIAVALEAEFRMHGTPTNTIARHGAEWMFNSTALSTGPATNRVGWTVWEIIARGNPSIQRRIAFEQAE